MQLRSLLPVAIVLAACGKHDSHGVPRDAGADAPAPATPHTSPAAHLVDALLGQSDIIRRTFPLKSVALRIEDVHMSRALDAVVQRADSAIFATNGGFFDPQNEPLGLALSNGRVLSKPTKTPGGILVVEEAKGTLYDAESFTFTPRPKAFGIQCLPRLVVKGEVNLPHDTGKRAERVALCLRDKGTVLDVVFARGKSIGLGPTLHELAEYLRGSGCEDALNLDGGPSAGIAWREDGAVQMIAPRGAVRHALVIHVLGGPTPPPP